jgi:hypothetical protein
VPLHSTALSPEEKERRLLKVIDILRPHEELKPAAHRPVGTGTFANREEFIALVAAAVHQLDGKRQHASQQRVAGYFRKQPKFPNVDDDGRQLRVWQKQFGFVSWADVLIAARAHKDT